MSKTIILMLLLQSLYPVTPISSCAKSKETITSVPACPNTLHEWKIRSALKQCWLVDQQCTSPEKFVYHCAFNSYANSTIEVCAPAVDIIGHTCVEFNILGGIIQESPYVNCSRVEICPFSYKSTDVYKYHVCSKVKNLKEDTMLTQCIGALTSHGFTMQNISSSRKETANSDEMIWQVVAVVFFIITTSLIILVICMRRKFKQKLKQMKNQNQDSTELLPWKDPEEIKHTEPQYQDSTTDRGKGHVITGNLSWVSSIDIGDTHCGMAYLDPNNAEDVKAVGKIERISVLMTQYGELKYFGDNAREMYISGKGDEVKDLKFVNELKMDKKKIKVGGSEYEPIKIYTEVIKYLLGKIRAEINKKQQGGESLDICYVFTVPKHWAELIEDLKAEIALHSRINKEKLHIKFRRVAIAPYIHEVRAAVLCLNFNVDNLSFKRNSTYCLLHIGSTYCSLLFLQVGDFKMPDEILDKPYKKEWKKAPEDKFVKIFEDIFTPDAVMEWKQTWHREYIALLDKFEKYKARMYENTEDSELFEFSLSENLQEIHKKLYNSQPGDIEKSLEEKHGMKLKIEDGKNILSLSWSELKTCFQEVINKAKTVVKEHKGVFTDKNVRCVIMTGIYPKMKYLQKEAEKKWFYGQQVTVAIPVDTGSIFAIGAAYYMNRYPSWAEYENKYDI